MSLTSALARIELAYLSDLVRPCADIVKDLDHVSTLQEDGIGGAFEKSLRVKSMIDALEVQAREEPSWKTLAAITSSEYRLWILNAETPLRHNPFLSHWVEAFQRLEADTKSHSATATTDNVSAEDIAATRLEMIKRLLETKDPNALATATPQQLYNARYPGTPFDVQPYIRILEEEGIYEPSPTPSTSITALPIVKNHLSTNADEDKMAHAIKIEGEDSSSNTPQKPTFQEWKNDLLSRLGTAPNSAFDDLTHLPIALPALDFLTTLVTTYTIDKYGIDSKLVVTSYIQHALRLVEHMGQPPESYVKPPRQTEIGIETDMSMLDRGREAQSRAIRLLLLFMKNLIRKGLVDVEPSVETTLYFEIQEICVGYVWMREVREFRTWLDEVVRGETTEED